MIPLEQHNTGRKTVLISAAWTAPALLLATGAAQAQNSLVQCNNTHAIDIFVPLGLPDTITSGEQVCFNLDLDGCSQILATFTANSPAITVTPFSTTYTDSGNKCVTVTSTAVGPVTVDITATLETGEVSIAEITVNSPK